MNTVIHLTDLPIGFTSYTSLASMITPTMMEKYLVDIGWVKIFDADTKEGSSGRGNSGYHVYAPDIASTFHTVRIPCTRYFGEAPSYIWVLDIRNNLDALKRVFNKPEISVVLMMLIQNNFDIAV